MRKEESWHKQRDIVNMGNLMPEIGEIKKAEDLGYKDSHDFIWHACVDCGKERWVAFRNDAVRSMRCKSLNV